MAESAEIEVPLHEELKALKTTSDNFNVWVMIFISRSTNSLSKSGGSTSFVDVKCLRVCAPGPYRRRPRLPQKSDGGRNLLQKLGRERFGFGFPSSRPAIPGIAELVHPISCSKQLATQSRISKLRWRVGSEFSIKIHKSHE